MSKPPPFPLPTPRCSCVNSTGQRRGEGWINKAKTLDWQLRPDGQPNHRGQVSESECMGQRGSLGTGLPDPPKPLQKALQSIYNAG